MKGLSKRLRSGRMVIASERQAVEIWSLTGKVVDTIHYADLTGSDWGYIYERHVAQYLLEDGFDVDQRGLTNGFADEGIDLIASKSGQRAFIQCKYTVVNKLSKQKIEWLLYKASAFLDKEYRQKKLNFWLVVPSMQQAFTKAKSKNKQGEYPLASYFLSKNTIQSKVRLEIREINMRR